MLIALFICVTIIIVSQGSEIIEAISQYKSKKLEEEHKTTNLALIYQILSTRPELSFEDVIALIDKKDVHSNMIVNKSTVTVNESNEN